MEFKVILLFGQSNCSGEALVSDYTTEQLDKKSKVMSFYRGSLYNFQAGKNNRRRAISEQRGGWEIELATQIEANYNGNVIFLKADEGGTGVSNRWNTATTGWDDSELIQARLQITAFEAFFAKNFPDDTFVYSAIAWNLGEDDSGSSAEANAFEVNCGNTWNNIKTHIGVSEIPIYDWLISSLYVGGGAFKATVNTAKQNLRAAHANGGELFSTEPADGYSFMDSAHYDADTYTLAGMRLYESLVGNGHL